jgi:hypothetical protein
MDDTHVLAGYDRAMRRWSSPEPGKIKIGSEAHKRLFCSMLLGTHNPYKPAVIQWPRLSSDTLRRVTSLPIWDIAVQTEGRASIRVKTFAERVSDPLLRSALVLDAAEESRHKAVLSKMVEAYGIKLAPEPAYTAPRNPDWSWLVTGYSECIDSFFAFGLFALAQRSGFFPQELVETFEPVMQEEGRHILFFVNWAAWYRANLPWWRRPLFYAKTLAVWAFLAWERIGIASGIESGSGAMQDANFAMSGGHSFAENLKPGELLDLCLSENERRMAGYDRRLLRPMVVPGLASLVRKLFGHS